jgi:hypothetical protein
VQSSQAYLMAQREEETRPGEARLKGGQEGEQRTERNYGGFKPAGKVRDSGKLGAEVAS